MSTMKRSVSLLLVLCFLLVAAPVTVRAATGGSCGENVTWSLSDDGVLTISGTGPMEDYFDKYSAPWGDYGLTISSVIIESGVTTIGDYAFALCNSLNNVEIPDSITTIGKYAFYYCSSLTSVVLPASVTTIEHGAFFCCHDLTSVEIPDSVTTIGDSAFDYCSSLTSVVFPASVTTIGNWAFYYCESLTSVEIPASVTIISDHVFSSCRNLTSVVIPDSVTTIGSGAFSSCLRLASVEVPDNVTTIGDWAFSSCIKLTSVEIPASVSNIGKAAFSDCKSLSGIYVDVNNPEFSNDDKGVLFDKQKTMLKAVPGAISGTYTVPASVTTIGDYAFRGCENLSAVKFTGNSPYIGYDAFWDVNATAYYPANNPTWTSEVMDNYGGNITWVPYESNPFSDVPYGVFYEDPVVWALENGITTGASATTFDPNGACLRAHVVTFLHRAAGSPEPTSTNNPFTDVASGSFFYKPVLWAVENSITNGTGATTFGAYDNCNRAAVVTFLWRAAGSPEPESTNNPFVDVATDAFYYKAVLWAVENGITNGVDATHFGPTANCTRAQVVTFLYRAYK